MPPPQRLAAPLLLAAALVAWLLHARAWDLGGRSPVLNYDSAQYALAARTLCETGRLASDYALPVELEKNAQPPWPLATVQPGLVLVEAALFRLAGPRERLVLLLPLLSFLAITLLLFAAGRRVAGDLGGAAAALAFALDPEAQHFAAGGFTELPFALGLLLALAAIASGLAARRPLVFGLLLGAAGAFRAQMAFLLPVLAAAAALSAPGRRRRVAALSVAGFALVLAPWWLYKWSSFGDAAWDLTRLVVWDRVDGNTWLSLLHRAELPRPVEGAATKLAGKAISNLPTLLLGLTVGARGALLLALLAALAALRPPRAATAAGGAALACLAASVLVAAVSIPWTRFLFPARVAAEAAGLWALMALAARAPATWSPRLLRVAAAVLVLAWGGWQSTRGLAEARQVSRQRGLPSSAGLRGLAAEVAATTRPGEPLMCNLGPVLAWHARRPVVHLALAPEDVPACRRRLDFRHVLLVFREGAAAWPAWRTLFETAGAARLEPHLGIAAARRSRTVDGFVVVWLELRPPEDLLASRQ